MKRSATEPATSKRPRGRPRTFDERDAVASAARTFHHRGFAGTSTDELARGMGLQKPSVYAAFGNKEALFRRAIEARAFETGQALQSAFVAGKSLADSVARLLRAAVDVYAPLDAEAPRGCLILGAVPDAAEELPEVRAWLERFVRDCDQALDRALAHQAPQLPPHERRRLASLLNAAVRDVAFRARAGASRRELLALANDFAELLAGS